jgi:hypothetical protein
MKNISYEELVSLAKENIEGVFDYNSYIKRVAEYQYKNPKLCYGEALYNVFYEFHPDIARNLRFVDFDPYYCVSRIDPKIKIFFNFLLEIGK